MIDLAELEKLANKATPLPWGRSPYLSSAIFWADGVVLIEALERKNIYSDLDYIIAACNAVPELVRRIRELEEELDEEIRRQWEEYDDNRERA